MIAAASGSAWLLSACTTTIVPPASVERPQPVFVLDHGRHTSLVLPHPDGLVRYAYGDWDWYAEVETGAIEATRAVLWPTPAGLGRNLTPGAATRSGVRKGVTVAIENLHEVVVEKGDLNVLRTSLETLYRKNRATLKYNQAYDLAFVEHPEPYTFWNNSNHKVAQWLRELGCEVEGSAFFARWEVKRGP